MHSIQYLKYKMSIKFVQNGKIIIQSSYPDIKLAWLHDDTNEEETRNIRNATLSARTASGFQTEFVFTFGSSEVTNDFRYKNTPQMYAQVMLSIKKTQNKPRT